MRDSIENISQLQKKLNDLQLENQILKNILDKAGLSYHKELSKLRQSGSKEAFDPEQGKRIIHPQAITENMANQFFSMFWGRQDVYAKRSVNKETGKAAYYPQCNNFWTNVCHKKIKDGINCKDCKNRSYKTITKKDILNHLQGNAYNASDVIGVYPLLSNGTCRFMVFDFDNHDKGAEEKDFANSDDTWVEEVESMREICVLNGIEPLVERSRSGRGAHVWIFFDKPIAASFVRKFGFALLDKGAEQINLKSFKYYDRMLPAQDSLPEDSAVGNLIALPLQGKALQDGNSAFIDGNWNAYPNQWETLFNKPRLSQGFLEEKIKEWSNTIDNIAANAAESDREKPWNRMQHFNKNDVEGKLHIVLSNGIYVDNTNLKAAMQNRIRRMAAISNPVFYKNQAIGTSNYDTARWIYLGKDHLSGYIQIPRGLQDELWENIKQADIDYEMEDERQQGRKINVDFKGELRPEQDKAYEIIHNNDVRDEQIIEDVKNCVAAGRTPVVLSRYKDHSEKFYERLKNYADHVFLMTGNNSKKEHRKILEQMHQVDKNESLILIATGSLVGEGFDFPRLDTLFMATPVSFRGVVEQYAGRLNRDYAGKENVIIYDYVDNHIPMFNNMYMKRLKAYKQIGYEFGDGLQTVKQTVNAIYDGNNYSENYHKDLLDSNKNIIISSPVISGSKVYELINMLKEKQMSGVQVTIVTWTPDSYGFGDAAYWMQLHEDMRRAGFYIRTVEEYCDRFAVIDQEVVWYGNINLLAKDKVDDSIMRVRSKGIAGELLEITFRNNDGKAPEDYEN